MHFSNAALLALAASFQLVLSAPADKTVKINRLLRLVKTSEEDPGKWVTEDQKFELFTSKGIGFIDITDIKDDEVLAALSSKDDSQISRRAITYPTTLSHVTEANSIISDISNAGPQGWLQTLTEFHNRHYRSTYGVQASTWLFNKVKEIASANSAITVRQVSHSFSQSSIIATLPGESSDLVIVGAHMDSTAGQSTARSPGADDNGSGSVVVLEALRVLVESGFKPKNTLEFHFYAGEEGGLLGSQDVYANYKSSGKTILAFLNQDMAGYMPNGKPAVFTDNVDSGLTSYVRLIATQYTGIAPSTSRCGYGCSDHASATSNGFPSAFVGEDLFEDSNPYIHSAQDTYDRVQWNSVLLHSKLTVGFLVEASYL